MDGPGAALRLVFWETTAGCNLACIHCRRLEVSQAMAKEDMTTEEAYAFVDSLAEFSRPILVLSGGEPLIRPDIFDIAGHARRRGLPVALATNGTLIDENMAHRIVEAGIRRVAISFDGSDAPTHDGFRRLSGAFEAALEGFRHLKRLGMSMQINCTLTQHNEHQTQEIYDMALREGADALHWFMLVPVGCGMQIAETNMLAAETYERILNWVYDQSKRGEIHLKATCAPHYFRIMRQRGREEGRPLQHEREGMTAITKGCLAGTSIFFVSHKGQVFPCGYLPVECGNVRHQSVREIWEQSAVFEKLRDPAYLEGKCGRCEYQWVCAGCRARAYYETGDYLDEEPYCIYEPIRKENPRRSKISS